MADSVIGALRVNLGLDSARFMTGVKNAKGGASGFKGALLALGAVAISTATGLAALGRNAIMVGAEIDRLATLSNTPVEQFQRWAAGAASVGIEQEKLSDILKDVNDRVGDFNATGGGPMLDFFEQIAPKIGLTADAFKGLSGADALQLYVSSLEKAGASQQDMTFFMEAMASDSTLLIPLLRDGGAAMQQMGDRAAELGAILDADTVAAMKRAKISLTEVGTVMSALGTRIGAAVAPALAMLADAFVSTMQAGGALRTLIDAFAGNLDRLAAYAGVAATAFGVVYVGGMIKAQLATMSMAGALVALRTAIMRTGVGLLIIGAGELVLALGRLITKVGGVGNAFSFLGDLAKATFRGIVDSAGAIPVGLEGAWAAMRGGFLLSLSAMTTDFQNFIWRISNAMISAGFEDMGANMRSLWGDMDLVNKGLSEAGNAAKDGAAAKFAEAGGIISDAFGPARDVLARLTTEVENSGSAADDAAGGITRFGDGIDRVAGGGGAGGGGKANKAAEALKALRDELTMLTATMGMSEQQAAIWTAQRDAGVSAVSAQGREIAAIIPQIDALKAANERVASTGELLKSSLGEAFRGVLSGAVKAKEAVGQLLGKLADMMLDAGFNALWDAIGKGAGGAGGGGFWGGVMKLFGFANGTPFAPGGLSRINERGGEIVDLPRGSKVIPHDVSMQMAKSSTRSDVAAVHVTASFDESGNLYVKRVSREQAISAVAAHDRMLNDRVKQINSNPRRR